MTDFFRINMPYGMQKNAKGQWMFFNREYSSLGNYLKDSVSEESSYYCFYDGVTEDLLESLAEVDSIERNDKGEITRLWFYNDRTTPSCQNIDDVLWQKYSNKLKLLCKLRRM